MKISNGSDQFFSSQNAFHAEKPEKAVKTNFSFTKNPYVSDKQRRPFRPSQVSPDQIGNIVLVAILWLVVPPEYTQSVFETWGIENAIMYISFPKVSLT